MNDKELVTRMTDAIEAALPVLTNEQKEAFANGFRLSADGFNVRFSADVLVGDAHFAAVERARTEGGK